MQDQGERDKLILEYRSAARLVALQAKRHMPPWIDIEDLEQWACLGLVEAAERYDPSHGTPFLGYAWRIMRGRLWEQYRRRQFQLEMRATAPLDEKLPALVEESISEEDLDHQRLMAQMLKAFLGLPRRDQTVLLLYYGQDLFHRQVGQRIGVNESRACQLNKRAVARLRRAMQRDAVLPTYPACG